jgi:hypothetical protein
MSIWLRRRLNRLEREQSTPDGAHIIAHRVEEAFRPQSTMASALPSTDRRQHIMDMLSGKQITAANLTDWRKLAHGCR